MTPVLVLSGGGVKSAVAAARYAKDHALVLLHVNFGQPAAQRETAAIEALAPTFSAAQVLRLGLPHVGQLHASAADRPEASVARGVVGTSAVAAPPSPTVLRGIIPVLCTVAVQSALRHGAQHVIVGLNRGAAAGQLGVPDFASQSLDPREFFHAFDIMTETWLRPRFHVRVEAPLLDLDDAEVVKLAHRFRVPLDKTWTCERFGTRPCTACDPCRARARAFADAGYADPAVAPPAQAAVR